MADGLADKRVLITAGGAGIGRAIAGAFCQAGARVHVCDIDAEALADARVEWPDLGTTLTDVADPGQVDRLFDDALGRLGGLDFMINNAGIAGPTAAVEDCDIEGWRRTLAVNLDATFYCARRAIPALKAAGGGAIINMSSSAGLFGYALRSPYVAAKWAIIGFTKTLAMELGPHGIRANAICPGPVTGPRMDRVIAAQSKARGVPEQEIRDSYTRNVSLRTFIAPEDIANAAIYLCSPAGARISGQAFPVDGHTESLSD
jgi:NAD(P)-dependent dehydrogenase (short-subunit alcohol dehydrogenase family)